MGAVLNINGATELNITGWTITNDGTISWTDGTVNTTATLINNTPTGIISATGELTLLDASGTSILNNAGVLTVCSDGNGVNLACCFNMSGLLDVETGTLQLTGGGQLTGTMTLADSANLELAQGTFTMQNFTQQGGMGTTTIGGAANPATLTLPLSPLPAALPNVVLQAGGTITGNGGLQVTNTMTWNGGTMQGIGTTYIGANIGNGTLSINARVTTNRNIWNNGTTTIAAGARLRLSAATFVNNFQLIMNSGSQLRRDINAGPSIVQNNGVLQKQGTDSALIAAQLTSPGAIDVLKGTLTLTNNNTYSGFLNVASGATLEFAQAAGGFPAMHSFIGAASFGGSGQVLLSDDEVTMSIASQLSLRIQNFKVSGGATIVSPAMTPQNPVPPGSISAQSFDWDSGTIHNAYVSVLAGDSMAIATSGNCILDNSPLLNAGQLNWTGVGDIILRPGASIVNDGTGGGGVFDIQNSQFMSVDANPNGPLGQPANPNGAWPTFQIVSGGTLTESGAAAPWFSLPVQNTNGKVNLQGNTLNIQGSYLATSAQTIIAAGGLLNIVGDYTQTGASSSTTVGGGTVTANNTWVSAGQFNMGGGTVNAAVNVAIGATLNDAGTINGPLMNNGTVAIGNGGPAGTLSVNGSYTQTNVGTLAITIGGIEAGAFDQLTVNGNAVLDGTVSVTLSNDFTVPAGNPFDFLTFTGQVTGNFAQVAPQGSAADYTWALLPPGNAYVAIQVQP